MRYREGRRLLARETCVARETRVARETGRVLRGREQRGRVRHCHRDLLAAFAVVFLRAAQVVHAPRVERVRVRVRCRVRLDLGRAREVARVVAGLVLELVQVVRPTEREAHGIASQELDVAVRCARRGPLRGCAAHLDDPNRWRRGRRVECPANEKLQKF